MLFSSFSFLAFFTLLVVAYYGMPHRVRWLLLVVASLSFYSTFKTSYVLLLAGSTTIAYLAGLAIGTAPGQGRRRAILAAGVVAELGALFVFKYADFFTGSLDAFLANAGVVGPTPLLPRLDLLVPVGLSFYSFSCVSYLADVYRGKLAPERHFGRLALYVSFFPKLLAGPIERSTTFLPQLLRPVRFNAEGVTLGLQLILWGLFKKVVIADRLAAIVDPAYRLPALVSPVDLVLATYFFAFQIYCDFSGYSDIAIGAARVLGFNLMDNFRRPYFSTSVAEFWSRRWHLSLCGWFRDYLYIPLGGNRGSRPRLYFNQIAVFVVSGLWHGANWTFIIWGGLNGLYQVLGLLTAGIRGKIAKVVRLPPVIGSLLSGLVTFHLILLAWVFFRAASIADAFTILARVVAALPSLPSLFAGRAYSDDIVLSVILIGVLLAVEVLDERRSLWESLRTRPVYVRWAVYYALLLTLVVIGRWNLKQFVYMQF